MTRLTHKLYAVKATLTLGAFVHRFTVLVLKKTILECISYEKVFVTLLEKIELIPKWKMSNQTQMYS